MFLLGMPAAFAKCAGAGCGAPSWNRPGGGANAQCRTSGGKGWLKGGKCRGVGNPISGGGGGSRQWASSFLAIAATLDPQSQPSSRK